MYNDEKNLYHYTYRKDGSEPTGQGPENSSAQQNAAPHGTVDEQLNAYRTQQSQQSAGQYQETAAQAAPADQQDVGKERKHVSAGRSAKMKIAALALVCALIGGAAGAGITTAVGRSSGSETLQVSGRQASSVAVKTVDGKTAMTDAEVYAATVNSVVSINCSSTTTNYFGQTVEAASSGSGFVLTADGYIATNHHVIADATSVKVTMYNGDTYDATVVGSDEDYDIAVLKIDAQDLQPVTLGDSDTLNVGDRVLAIGNPLGELTFSQTGGMVSCVNRAINVDGTPFNMIQTDASINPGNSGGPLMNSYGEVVGIVSAKYSSTSNNQSAEGLGFAIPINDVMAMIKDIMTNGYVTNKPYLGATVGTMNQSMAQSTNLTQGAYIYAVEQGGAADQAGLKAGDVITKIDDKTITSLEDLTAAKKGYSAGDTADVTVYRNGETTTVKLTWGAVPKDKQTAQTDTSTSATDGQNGDSYGSNNNMEDLFRYFFGQQYGNSGTGTAA